MDYGFAVNNYNLYTGSYGDIIKVDIKNNYPFQVLWVQGENDSGAKSIAIEGPGVSLSALTNYMEDEECPDLAWSFNGTELSIFFKHDVYDVRFGYEIKRDAKPVTLLTDYIDVAEDLMPLFELYMSQEIQRYDNYQSYKLVDLIKKEESKFILEEIQ